MRVPDTGAVEMERYTDARSKLMKFGDLTEWLEQEADVVVEKLDGNVPCIGAAFPPGTLLVREDQFTYRITNNNFYFNDL